MHACLSGDARAGMRTTIVRVCTYVDARAHASIHLRARLCSNARAAMHTCSRYYDICASIPGGCGGWWGVGGGRGEWWCVGC